jgi:hypothetical protein
MVALHGQPRSFVGINLTKTTVSVVELIDRGTRLELATYALADIPPDAQLAVSTYDPAATKQLVNFLSQVFEQAALSSDAAIFSLYSPHIFSTVLDLPVVADQELMTAINYKARDLVPADLKEMVITATRPNEHKHHVPWQQTQPASIVLSPPLPEIDPSGISLKQTTDQSRYLIHAIPLQTIKWYRELASFLHLDLIALEENVFPILRIHPVTNSHCTFFAQIDPDTVNLYSATRSAVCLTRTIDLSHLADNNQIQIYITDEIEHTVARHAQTGFPPPSQVYLLGHSTNLTSLQQTLAKLLPCPVKVSQPFSGLSYPQGIEQSLSAQGPTFTVAVGLAKRQINNL